MAQSIIKLERMPRGLPEAHKEPWRQITRSLADDGIQVRPGDQWLLFGFCAVRAELAEAEAELEQAREIINREGEPQDKNGKTSEHPKMKTVVRCQDQKMKLRAEERKILDKLGLIDTAKDRAARESNQNQATLYGRGDQVLDITPIDQ